MNPDNMQNLVFFQNSSPNLSVEERSTAKNYCPISLLSMISKVFEKLVNNRIIDHLQKCDLFSDFQYGLGLLDQLQIFSQ